MIHYIDEIETSLPNLVLSLDKLALKARQYDQVTNGYFNFPDDSSPEEYYGAYKEVERMVNEMIDIDDKDLIKEAIHSLKRFGYTVDEEQKHIACRTGAFSYF